MNKSKLSSTNDALCHHIRTLGSMQAGSIDFVSNILPTSIRTSSSPSTERLPSDSVQSYKTNTIGSSSSSPSSGYESILSRSLTSHKSFVNRLKRLIHFPTSKKTSDHQILTKNTHRSQNNSNSPILSSIVNHINEIRPNSSTRFNIKRKASRQISLPITQHIPFLHGLKNCGNTW